MDTLGTLLKKLRGKESLREAAVRAGISHNYLSQLEKGIDPRTGKPIQPSAETLKSLAEAYNYKYEELLKVAGILDNIPKENESVTQLKTREELLQELTDDPDDYFFLDGYLHATEEEKKELRRQFYENKKRMRENNIKPTAPMSLRDFNEKIKNKPD